MISYYDKFNTVIDIDECETESDPCPSSAYCNNTYGSYLCICTNGTKMDDKGDCTGITINNNNIYYYDEINMVIDIDECSDDTHHDCSENAKCENVQGSYTCTCDIGFEGDGQICTSVLLCCCMFLFLFLFFYHGESRMNV